MNKISVKATARRKKKIDSDACSSPSGKIMTDALLAIKIIDESSDIYYVYDLSLQCNEYINNGFEKCLGYPVSEVKRQGNKLLPTLFHPDDYTFYMNNILPRYINLKEGESVEHEYRLLHKNGDWRWFHSRDSIYSRNPAGTINKIFGIIQDITKRKQIEYDILESEKKLRTLANNIPDIISRFDEKLHYSYVNPIIEKYLGQKPAAFLGKAIDEFLMPKESVEQLNAKISEVFSTGKPCRYEFDLITTEGRRYFSSRILPEFNDEGVVISVLSVARDITERRLAESALRESEQRYRKMIQILPDGIVIHTDGKVVFANESARIILNAESIDQMIGVSVMDFVHPDFKELVAERIISSTKNQSTLSSMEELFLTFDGKPVQVRVNSTSFIYLGKPSILTVITDISERKRTELALLESNDIFNMFLEYSPIYIYFKDQNARPIRLSKNFEQLLNRPLASMIGQSMNELFPSDLAKSMMNDDFIVIMNGVPVRVIEEMNGRKYSTTKFPMKRPGKPNYLAGFTIDITERYKIEEKINHLNQELEQRVVERTAQLTSLNKELESFAYSVSHDLRAPLRAIDGFSQLLEETYDSTIDDLRKNYLDRIRKAAQNMAKLIDDLLNLSRISRQEMNIQSTDLSRIADDIMKSLIQSDSGRVVNVVIKPGLAVMGDMLLLRSLMENLLKNAWKFTSKHSISNIEFGSTVISGKQVYFIRDDGTSFDMTYIEKLFGPFQRLHAANDFPGTGIGLATVHKIISKHGGEIWAEGKTEKGATFYFTIPEIIKD